MIYRNTIILSALGLLSEIISILLIPATVGFGIFFIPGLVFGAITALYFLFFRITKHSYSSLLLWVFISTISYFIAVLIAIFTPHIFNNFLHICSAGTIGALLIISGFHILLFRINRGQFRLLTLLGGVLSLSFYISFYPDFIYDLIGYNISTGAGYYDDNFLPLNIIWQAGMAAGFGWVLDTEKKK